MIDQAFHLKQKVGGWEALEKYIYTSLLTNYAENVVFPLPCCYIIKYQVKILIFS